MKLSGGSGSMTGGNFKTNEFLSEKLFLDWKYVSLKHNVSAVITDLIILLQIFSELKRMHSILIITKDKKTMRQK